LLDAEGKAKLCGEVDFEAAKVAAGLK